MIEVGDKVTMKDDYSVMREVEVVEIIYIDLLRITIKGKDDKGVIRQGVVTLPRNPTLMWHEFDSDMLS